MNSDGKLIADGWPTVQQIVDALTMSSGYNTNLVVFATTVFGLAAGVVGLFALLRKRSLMSDALSHATLPGICAAFLLGGFLGINPKQMGLLLCGAALTGVMAVLCVQLMLRYTRLPEDASIGMVLSSFFGCGAVLLSVIQNTDAAHSAGLDRFIYGQAAAMNLHDAAIMGGLAALSLVVVVALLKELCLVSFDQHFAEIAGIRVSAIDLVTMSLVVCVTVSGLQAVGLILVVALLIIPPVAARLWSDRLWVVLLLSALIGATSGYVGSVISSLFPRKPTGAVIVLTAGAIFFLSMLFAPRRGVVSALTRESLFRIRVARDHLLEELFSLSGKDPSVGGAVPWNGLHTFAAERGWSRALLITVVFVARATGCLVGTRSALRLTPRGRARGAAVMRNHYLWEQFLLHQSFHSAETVGWSVDQVEHVLSEELVAELEMALKARGITVPARGEVRYDQ